MDPPAVSTWKSTWAQKIFVRTLWDNIGLREWFLNKASHRLKLRCFDGLDRYRHITASWSLSLRWRKDDTKENGYPTLPRWWETVPITNGAIQTLPSQALLSMAIYPVDWLQGWGNMDVFSPHFIFWYFWYKYAPFLYKMACLDSLNHRFSDCNVVS